MLNTLIVVYRESFEAILIIGILYSYLKLQKAESRAFQYMWGGIAAGILLSGLLGWAITAVQNEVQGRALDYFNYAILASAIVLMTHMCVWMKQHARTLKSELQSGLSVSLSSAQYWGIATLSCLAVGREGSETVIFLQGMFIEAQETHALANFAGMAGLGFILSLITFWIFNRGFRFFKPHIFFRVTTAFLFITASSLMISLARKLIQDEVIPGLKDPVWDTSFLLDERSSFGQVFSAITGYQSTPALMAVLVYFAYWAIALFFYYKPSLGLQAQAAK